MRIQANRVQRPNFPSVRTIRSRRRKAFGQAVRKFGGYDRLPRQLRQNLEREPVVRARQNGKRLRLSLRELSLMAISKRFNPESDFGAVRVLGKVVLRQTFEQLGLTPTEAREIQRILREDSYLSEKIWGSVNNLPRRESYEAMYYRQIIFSLSRAFYSSGEESDAVVRKKAETFYRAFRSNMLFYQRQPLFYKTGKGKTVVLPERGFSMFLNQLRKNGNITGFIEAQPEVERQPQYSFLSRPSIFGLPFLSYDISKVKQFSISNGRGKTLQVVSKRLSPIKSITAEKEFEASKFLWQNGIRTPQPVGMVKDKGNTYFLWIKLNAVTDPDVLQKHKKSIEHQKQELDRKLTALGVQNRDIADRNLVVTIENRQPIVWLIDLERVTIPRTKKRRV